MIQSIEISRSVLINSLTNALVRNHKMTYSEAQKRAIEIVDNGLKGMNTPGW